jgi:HEAT repeat protein
LGKYQQNELFHKLVNELKSHKTPEANLMLRSFLREDSTVLVLHTITLIGYPDKDFDFAPDLIRLAEGKDKAVALRALSNLSDWYSNREHVAEITSMIKRLYASKDAEVILQAAILSCRYSSDWSGFPMLLEATKKPDKKIALKAIEQLRNSQYRSYAKEVVPLLIPHLQTKDLNLLEYTIRTFGNYNGSAKHILPLLQHKENYIVNSTIIALNLMDAIEAIAPLEDLLQKTTDDTTRDCINAVLLSLKQLQQKH